ncbi:MAG: tRNA (adenosine(37)-N6)-threonylcarbamoyltransferase complex ATPase subunit type 1 TsaE [Firmicutes bacterium]|nr:tRNA (adenosine(37)-N6)-threonylcarbamoyltransferase complex ATPase subunit type 1 TsaE [Bacillota bacterium]
MVYESFSADETKALGEKIAQSAEEGSVFCLSGDLGVGKTVFTKGFAEGIGVDEYITSPTFTIVNEYEGRFKFYHFDVYRITDPDELFDIGFEEYIYGNGVCLIEWAEIVKEDIPEGAVWITIEKDLEKGLDYRRITVEGGAL